MNAASPAKSLAVNGDPCAPLAATLEALLAELGHEPNAVATALNGEFVPRRKRADTPLKDGDCVEILAPRQGG